jgi:3-methyladenine DNA glycosylase Tag
MPKFKPILDKAIKRMGGLAPLEKELPKPKSTRQLKALPDDRYLSAMCLRIFRAGLKHTMVDAKWPAFEEVFHAFDPGRVAAMHEEALEELMKDRRLIRHWPKMKAARANAAILVEISQDAGGFGAWLAAWPGTDITGLWAEFATRFNHMGGKSGPYFLRMVDKDTFVLSEGVVDVLVDKGVVSKKPTTKADLAATQAAFNEWAEESGRPLCHLSRICALSVG